MKSTSIQIRQFSRLTYCRPESVLREFREIEIDSKLAHGAEPPNRVRQLRTNKLKEPREARLAAIFAYAMQECVLRVPVGFAPHEEADYDFVVSWVSEEASLYCPVQLKELTPDDINPKLSMEDVLGKLRKYVDSKDLVVAIHYNRLERFEYGPWLRIASAPVAQIWYFGGCSSDGNDWFLYGDLMKEPACHRFCYPA